MRSSNILIKPLIKRIAPSIKKYDDSFEGEKKPAIMRLTLEKKYDSKITVSMVAA